MIDRVGDVLALNEGSEIRKRSQRLNVAWARRQILARLHVLRRVEFPEASQAGFVASVIYGTSILLLLARFLAHKVFHLNLRQFQSFPARYRKVQ